MPSVAGREEAPRRLAPVEALNRQPPRRSTSSQEGRRTFSHRRSRSSSKFELSLVDVKEGGEDGRKQQQQQKQQQRQRREPHRSRDQYRLPACHPRVVDVGCRSVGVGIGRGRSFSYCRLPEYPLRLTIVKLDRSSFDVQVMKSASVLGLKLAVEEIFSRSPKGEGMISWSLVWSHFCLCYKDQKLADDKASLKAFGIKDGDKLHFIRYVTLNCKQRPRKQRQWTMELTGSEAHEGSELDEVESDDTKAADEGSNYIDRNSDDQKFGNLTPEFKPAHSLRGWRSYSGFWFSAKAMLGTTARFSRLKNHYPEAGKM
ncbi:hypothetical protein Taro_036858 [Colocasia esculenta]|uniref:SNRNP25 ubiquitin-like domain-containing protein n=1 Tax=Colocasia esculenta TaxID=4460 RepID=A0A843VYR7_COLES|nr:hypothetical protein [Colocasia esculenta]